MKQHWSGSIPDTDHRRPQEIDGRLNPRETLQFPQGSPVVLSWLSSVARWFSTCFGGRPD